MRIIKILQPDQELVTRFLAVFGKGLAIAGHSKAARPGFFVFASNFIHEYIEPVYFKREGVLLTALEDCGFSAEDGPIGTIRAGYEKSREISKVLSEAAKQWQSGDVGGRAEAIWATSEYADVMRHHFEMLKSRIHPLLEQSLPPEGEQKAAEDLNHLAFEEGSPDTLDKYVKMVDMLEEEVGTWQ